MKYPFRALSLPCLFAVCLFCMEAFVLPAFSRAQEHPFLRVEAGGHNASIRAVLFTPDGKRVISAGYDKVARVWDATGARAEQLQTLRYHIGDGESGEITSAAISPQQDHPQLALGVKEDNISCVRVIDYVSGQVLRTLRGDADSGVVTALHSLPTERAWRREQNSAHLIYGRVPATSPLSGEDYTRRR